ncbi:glucosaminidase domain and LysM peptidoglycan-binding domain-containing protein [Desertivirga xinjiangensis]|uniref:glucosaminidase domain and LysM peptidoglycan-binding domain-containing protein n=1 Tax=Desertivirga xinjiangensis TaxID=539206 RepID=UPI00210BF03F|nr:glucosaminidase domain-containing protein [Pedobacter xinjiangensis]
MLKNLLKISLILLITGTASAQSAADKYVASYKEAAIRTMNQHGVPASIVLGIAIHESASGTSRIAKYLNNHFGLKGKSGPKPIPSAYKGYESVDDCYADFVAFLKKRVNSLFIHHPAGDYKKWATGIQRGGYAASKTWASQVMGIIKKYKLYEYDNGIPESIRPVETIKVTSNETTKQSTTYRVKYGDTLVEIAEKFNTTVKNILLKNSLKTSNLSIGQELQL